MSQELSRVKSRQKRQKESPAQGKRRAASVEPAVQPAGRVRVASGTLSRKARYSTASVNPAEESQTGDGEHSTPSRSQTYSSERVRLSKMFVNSLIFIFVLLLASLLVWGIKGAPPLKTLW
ncbi:hypothetical protein GCM10010912_20780 [Paenibacillus albidus]|uniref:Uncharacterized protein n=1 Tax=Paenibacillus albidus TaxID=2041023 RepID=A0A917FH33_9BACL|nr:hypothetical protein [Paenibacillus albidus]GGF75442.1 hypothetical protein GCM10010912_20780 [Paenibacillus albidus]